MSHAGGCLCGAVRYAVEGALGPAINCHCKSCRRAHGAAFATTMLLATRHLRVTAGEERVARHGQRYFCDCCRARLWNRLDSPPQTTMLVVSSLDEEPGAEPAIHVNLESKAPWYTIRDDAPCFEAFPPNVDAALDALDAPDEATVDERRGDA